ncbi:PREDICTED: probable thiopurine S-methyltransferase [Branchiostoma belcheri]|uniref:thiopurine S-methyltransferase n=1 Tax=Branchiostoma belcheri TaxID=7741 RepID=A0A6P4ZVJ7_BRABE|nr:PREDICTED: probable thiopurine S-methyltransferase [Branchiostoma belcheri]
MPVFEKETGALAVTDETVLPVGGIQSKQTPKDSLVGAGDKRAKQSAGDTGAEKPRMVKMVNQDLEEVETRTMTLEDWHNKWRRGKTKFHMSKVHPNLQKFYNRMIQGEGRKRIFVPMCGKTLDMKWLSDKGHGVVGNEVVEMACRQFFEEHDLQYTTERIEGVEGTLFKATDIDLQLFNCDYYKLTSDVIGTFDCIWDRGAMAAANPEDRDKYAAVIVPLLKPTGAYLLDLFELENTVFAGPPHGISDARVDELFASKCNIEELLRADRMGDWQRSWGLDSFKEVVRLLTPKQT